MVGPGSASTSEILTRAGSRSSRCSWRAPLSLRACGRVTFWSPLDGVAVAVAADVAAIMDAARPGDDVVAQFLREGRADRRTLHLRAAPKGPWPSEDPRASAEARADAMRRASAWAARLREISGLSVVSIPDELRAHYGAAAGRGVLVTRVEPGSGPRKAGVEVGDVLVRVGATVVRDPGDLQGAVAVAPPESSLELEVVRARASVVLELEPPIRTGHRRRGGIGGWCRAVRSD